MRLLPLLLVLAFAALPASAQTPDTTASPAWRPFDEAVEAARTDGRRLLFDVYAPWCGWCRKMQAEVYTDPAVRAYLADHFVLTRVNLDDTTDALRFRGYTLTPQELAVALGATATPSTVFLEPDGAAITLLPGYVETPTFLEVLRYVGSGAYETQSFEAFTAP